jgi:CHRD domain
MKRSIMISAALAATLCAAATAQADDSSTVERFHARLSGFNEVGGVGAAQTGAILSDGTATAEAELDKGAGTATYTLTLSGFRSNVLQAHIHFGKTHVGGGILVFFCSNLPSPPPNTPACPQSGTVTGTWTAASVRAIPGQNVTAGDFDALVDALESNTAYANIHTVSFPVGEIRGQMRHTDRDD